MVLTRDGQQIKMDPHWEGPVRSSCAGQTWGFLEPRISRPGDIYYPYQAVEVYQKNRQREGRRTPVGRYGASVMAAEDGSHVTASKSELLRLRPVHFTLEAI